MIHEFRFEIEGKEMPFQAFSITVGERAGEAIVSVPPLSAFFHLPPGTYARLVYLDDALKKEAVMFDGVLTGVSLAKSATGMTVDLRFVDPLKFVFPFPLAALSFSTSPENLLQYAKLAEFLLQRVQSGESAQRTTILAALTELSELLNENVTVDRYVKRLMEVVFEASEYTSRVARKFSAASRYKVFAEGRRISDFLKTKAILEYFLKYAGTAGLSTVGEYFEKFLDVVSHKWYYQAVFLGGANVLVVPKRLFFSPPKTNVFAPCAIVTMDLFVDHTTPTRVLVTMEAGDVPLYEIFPSSSISPVEEMRGVWPDFVSVPLEEFLAAAPNLDVKSLARFFARRQLYEKYLFANTGNVKTPFYPYALVGFPAIVLTPSGHYAGVLVAARHEYTVEGNAASFFSLAGVVPASIVKTPTPSWVKEAYARLGTKSAEGESVAEAAASEYLNYERTVASFGKSDEAKFWAWYREHAPLNTSAPAFSGFDKRKQEMVEKVRAFLTKHPIVTLRGAERLERELKGLEELVYPVQLWQEGLE